MKWKHSIKILVNQKWGESMSHCLFNQVLCDFTIFLTVLFAWLKHRKIGVNIVSILLGGFLGIGVKYRQINNYIVICMMQL